MGELVVTNLAVAAASNAAQCTCGGSALMRRPIVHTSNCLAITDVSLIRLMLEAAAPEIIAAEREQIRRQPPVCPPGAPPNVLCMTCFRPMCRACGACECPDYTESLCHG